MYNSVASPLLAPKIGGFCYQTVYNKAQQPQNTAWYLGHRTDWNTHFLNIDTHQLNFDNNKTDYTILKYDLGLCK